MKKKLLLLMALCLFASINGSAYDAEVDGIYYDLVDGFASVTFKEEYPEDQMLWISFDYSGDVIIPESITYNGETYPVLNIGYKAFFCCRLVSSVTFLGNPSISDEAFWGCSGLTSFTIPERGSVGSDALSGVLITPESFVNNSSYPDDFFINQGITLFDGKETSDGLLIRNNTVVRCRPWATSIIIPDNVTSIDANAFYACIKLTDVWCLPENVPTTSHYDEGFIYSNADNATLHVPAASLEAYYANSVWREFGSFAPIYDENSSRPFPAGKYRKVDLKRTFVEGWNTICLPFNTYVSDFGSDARAYEFTGFTGVQLKFTEVYSLTAGTPYVIYVPSELPEIMPFYRSGYNTIVEIVENSSSIEKNGVYFRGTYAPVAAGEWMKNNSTNDIYGMTAYGAIRKAGAEASILGFRGYFDIPAGTEVKGFVFDDATGIETIDHSSLTIDHPIYNVAGQRIKKMQKGINIINGKKILK